MKIYIMTDLEGVSGVSHERYIDEESPFFPDARRYLMGDVNAAIAGCFDGGASEVVVRDGHFMGQNFIMNELDDRAIHDYGTRPWTGILDETFDATMMIGQHAMAGTQDGFLDHTMTGRDWWQYSLNAVAHGELGMWAAIAGQFGVPMVYLCGDKAACLEAQALIPGITTTAVKEGRGRLRAACRPVAQAQAAIQRDTAEAVRRIGRVSPYVLTMPATCELITCRADHADTYDGRPGVLRVGARTLRKEITDARDMLV